MPCPARNTTTSSPVHPDPVGDVNADGFQDYCVRVETGGLVATYAFRALIGGFVDVLITEALPNSLRGRLVGSRAAA